MVYCRWFLSKCLKLLAWKQQALPIFKISLSSKPISRDNIPNVTLGILSLAYLVSMQVFNLSVVLCLYWIIIHSRNFRYTFARQSCFCLYISIKKGVGFAISKPLRQDLLHCVSWKTILKWSCLIQSAEPLHHTSMYYPMLLVKLDHQPCTVLPHPTACNTCTSLSYIFSTTAHALNRPRSVWSIARSSSSVAATQPSPAPPTLECSTNGKKLKVISHIQLSIYHYFKYKVREAWTHQMVNIKCSKSSLRVNQVSNFLVLILIYVIYLLFIHARV